MAASLSICGRALLVKLVALVAVGVRADLQRTASAAEVDVPPHFHANTEGDGTEPPQSHQDDAEDDGGGGGSHPCAWKTTFFMNYDLNPISRKKGDDDWAVPFSSSVGDGTIYLNICNNVLSKPPQCAGLPSSPGYRVLLNGTGPSCTPLGDVRVSHLQLLDFGLRSTAADNGLLLAYKSPAGGRGLYYRLFCVADGLGRPQNDGCLPDPDFPSEPCIITWFTSAACPDAEVHRYVAGASAFFVLLFLWCGCRRLYRYWWCSRPSRFSAPWSRGSSERPSHSTSRFQIRVPPLHGPQPVRLVEQRLEAAKTLQQTAPFVFRDPTTEVSVLKIEDDDDDEPVHAEPVHESLEKPQHQDTEPDGESAKCTVCFDAARSVVFQACGHGVCCVQCATELLSQNEPKCPFCRADICTVFRIVSWQPAVNTVTVIPLAVQT